MSCAPRSTFRRWERIGLERRHLPELLEKSAAASSMKANPIALTREEMEEIVLAALGATAGISGDVVSDAG